MPKPLFYGGGNSSNTYLIPDNAGYCLIVDPGAPHDGALLRKIQNDGLKITAILLTHGHFDHIGGLDEIIQAFGDLPVYISQEDVECFANPRLNASFLDYEPRTFTLPKDLRTLTDGEKVEIGSFAFKAIATPFHTRGSMCFLFEEEKILYSGDTLFRGAVGRYDLPGSCPRFLSDSLRKFLALDDAAIVYPGHGPKTSLGNERPWLRGYI